MSQGLLSPTSSNNNLALIDGGVNAVLPAAGNGSVEQTNNEQVKALNDKIRAENDSL